MLSLSELAKIHKKKQKCKTKTYDAILNKCHTQIRNMAKRDQTFCYYVVPLYVMGLPLYDINACIVYLLLNLKKKGFYVQMADSQTIYISWKHIYEQNVTQQQRNPNKNSNNWSEQNQRFLQNKPRPLSLTYNSSSRSNQMGRFIERSKSLL